MAYSPEVWGALNKVYEIEPKPEFMPKSSRVVSRFSISGTRSSATLFRHLRDARDAPPALVHKGDEVMDGNHRSVSDHSDRKRKLVPGSAIVGGLFCQSDCRACFYERYVKAPRKLLEHQLFRGHSFNIATDPRQITVARCGENRVLRNGDAACGSLRKSPGTRSFTPKENQSRLTEKVSDFCSGTSPGLKTVNTVSAE